MTYISRRLGVAYGSIVCSFYRACNKRQSDLRSSGLGLADWSSTMSQSVVILDEEPGFPLGSQLRSFLQRAGGYDIHLIHEAPITVPANVKRPQRILIPILPSAKATAEALLADF